MLNPIAAAKLLGINLKEAAHLWGGLRLLLTARHGGTDDFDPRYGLGHKLMLSYRGLTMAQWLSGDRRRFARWEQQLMDAALERFKAQGPANREYLPIAEVDPDIDPAEFRERFVRHPKPVVIRGLANNCDAIGKWSREYFLERYGDTKMYMNRIEYGDQITITEWLGQLREVLENSNVYVDNSKVLFARFPELVEDIADVPNWGKLLGTSLYMMPQLFLGDTPGAPFHCANHWNFFVMAKGRKQWTFISPEHSLQVGALLNPSGIYADGCATGKDNTWRDRSELFTDYCPKYRTVVEEGDVLLNPPWWWHEIENLTPFPIGIATRWIVMNYERTNTLFDLVQMLSPSVWKVYYHGIVTRDSGAGDATEDDILRRILANRETNDVYRFNYGVRGADPTAPVEAPKPTTRVREPTRDDAAA